MKRLLFVMLALVCVLVEVHAQYNIYVKNSAGQPLQGVEVYTFPSKKKGKAAYDVTKKSAARFYDPQINKEQLGIMAEGKTDGNGLCVIECLSTGAIILDGNNAQSGDYAFKLYYVDEYQKSKLDLNIEIVLPEEGVDTGEGSLSGFFGGITHKLKGVEKETYMKMKDVGPRPPLRFGNKIKIERELDIEGDLARNDARFVAFPYIVFSEYKDSVTYLPPAAVDGKDYEKSMVRRMSFQPSRDKLNEYRFDHAMHMQDHNSERFLYSELATIEKGTKYYVPGILWYEDYNGVYHRDSVLFNDGKEREPMRFLDWSEARKLAPIDREKFEKSGTYEAVPENASYNLKFEQGKSSLNLRDSATLAQRDEMLDWIGSYVRNKVDISEIIIRGYSSPEGSEALNRKLSHSRAQTIESLLKSHFSDINIISQFDENDNIVPWEKVADVMMMEADDTLAHMYADKVRELIADKKGFDAQNRVILGQTEMYSYISSNVLERVRLVDIQANVIVHKILSNEEIVERYEKDPEFRRTMMPYQYYVMMCYLADQERWNELYDISKQAYEKMSQERSVDKYFLKAGTKDTLRRVPNVMVPYPLAGYYYAMATLRKGMSDLEILKPFLDDGSVNVRPVMNGLPFIVTQVLMYCQRDDLDGAIRLIEKYRLMTNPELHGLVMYVLCLNGQFDRPDVQNYVMSSSEMNRAVILIALGKYDDALRVLYSDAVSQEDAKVEYMKAISLFNRQGSAVCSYNVEAYKSDVIYVEDNGDSVEETRAFVPNISTWAVPMLNALRLDNSNAKYLETDGYFNNAYRQMVLYFWNRMQAGVPIKNVAREYDALVARMKANAKEKIKNK